MTISLICAACCLVGGGLAFAQEVGDDIDEGDVEMVDGEDFDDEDLEDESPYDYRGPYARAGVSYANFDEEDSDIKFDDAVGFTVAVGWRHSAWFALELSFASFFGSETDDYLEFDRAPNDEEDGSKSLSSTEFAVNAKFYPFGAMALRNFDESPLLYNVARMLPDIVQPYGAIGFGYSLQDVAVLDQTRPAFRFVGGVDVIVWEPVAITVEGGYTLHEHLVRRNRGTHIDGTGHVSVGATVRF
ncbi:MAG: outer membrane beta-barrel protein [Myxococcota bacterium]|jgi:hypothetical protein|nr:outer membrane beta-barrel protein [Myxococcota bacterium]